MAVVEAEAELMAAASGSRADLPDRGRERASGRGWLGRLAARPGIAVACVALLASGMFAVSAIGVAWVLAQALCVVVLAELQWTGLRRTRGHAGMAVA